MGRDNPPFLHLSGSRDTSSEKYCPPNPVPPNCRPLFIAVDMGGRSKGSMQSKRKRQKILLAIEKVTKNTE